jgi:ABC-type polysaccharide/polyol phosphate transport system ATPase subunit
LTAVPTVVPVAPAVFVDGVSKTFALPKEKMHTFKERALHPLKRTEFDVLNALSDVSFSVPHGEFFGIVGRNGSGKSTLLKCLAGIYRVDSGSIYVNGRMSTFIELGVGFNPDLAARDNATLNAIMLGLSRRDAEERYQRILDFSELHEFEDLKIKNYSSGMLVRLAFSVMVQVNADILLIDEVLAVGDVSFQQKCYDEFARLRDERRTILFVTHDMASVQRFCDRAMLLERGEMVMLDSAGNVADRYFDLNFRRGDDRPTGAPSGRTGDGGAEVLEGWFEDERGERLTTMRQGERCTYCTRVRFNEAVQDPIVSALIENAEHRPLFASSSAWEEPDSGSFAAGEEVVLRLAFENWLTPDRYFATTTVSRRGGGADVMDQKKRVASLIVTGVRQTGGLVELPHDLVLERTTPAPAVREQEVG